MGEMSAILRKETDIWLVISDVARAVGGYNFELIDHWDADLYAIGIKNPNSDRRLVYVTIQDAPPGRLKYECEDANGMSVETREAVEVEDLLKALGRHLGIERLPSS